MKRKPEQELILSIFAQKKRKREESHEEEIKDQTLQDAENGLILPSEILLYIFSFLNPKEIVVGIRSTCRLWKGVSHDNYLWQFYTNDSDRLRATLACYPNLFYELVTPYLLDTKKIESLSKQSPIRMYINGINYLRALSSDKVIIESYLNPNLGFLSLLDDVVFKKIEHYFRNMLPLSIPKKQTQTNDSNQTINPNAIENEQYSETTDRVAMEIEDKQVAQATEENEKNQSTNREIMEEDLEATQEITGENIEENPDATQEAEEEINEEEKDSNSFDIVTMNFYNFLLFLKKRWEPTYDEDQNCLQLLVDDLNTKFEDIDQNEKIVCDFIIYIFKNDKKFNSFIKKLLMSTDDENAVSPLIEAVSTLIENDSRLLKPLLEIPLSQIQSLPENVSNVLTDWQVKIKGSLRFSEQVENITKPVTLDSSTQTNNIEL